MALVCAIMRRLAVWWPPFGPGQGLSWQGLPPWQHPEVARPLVCQPQAIGLRKGSVRAADHDACYAYCTSRAPVHPWRL